MAQENDAEMMMDMHMIDQDEFSIEDIFAKGKDILNTSWMDALLDEIDQSSFPSDKKHCIKGSKKKKRISSKYKIDRLQEIYASLHAQLKISQAKFQVKKKKNSTSHYHTWEKRAKDQALATQKAIKYKIERSVARTIGNCRNIQARICI